MQTKASVHKMSTSKRTRIVCAGMTRVSLLLPAIAWSAMAAVNVPLIVQEAIYPGSPSGVARTSDPVTIAIPLPDDPTTGLSDVNQLTLSGASVGQFRVLGRWPS